MFPDQLTQLDELAQLPPEALLILARRFERLARLCRSACKTKSEDLQRKEIAHFEHRAAIEDLRSRVARLYRAGFSMRKVRESLPQWEPEIVNFQYREAAKIARQRNGLKIKAV